jgi:hypothetical protein
MSTESRVLGEVPLAIPLLAPPPLSACQTSGKRVHVPSHVRGLQGQESTSARASLLRAELNGQSSSGGVRQQDKPLELNCFVTNHCGQRCMSITCQLDSLKVLKRHSQRLPGCQRLYQIPGECCHTQGVSKTGVVGFRIHV